MALMGGKGGGIEHRRPIQAGPREAHAQFGVEKDRRPVPHDDPTDSRGGRRRLAAFALAGRWVIVMDLDHPVLGRTVELVRSVTQDGRVATREIGDA